MSFCVWGASDPQGRTLHTGRMRIKKSRNHIEERRFVLKNHNLCYYKGRELLGSWDINKAKAVADRSARLLLSGPNIEGVICLVAQSQSDRDIWVEVINCASVGDFEGAIKSGLCSTLKPVEEEYVIIGQNQTKISRKGSESSLGSEYDVIDEGEFLVVNTEKCYGDELEVDSTRSMTPCEVNEESQWMSVDTELQVECIEGVQLLPPSQPSNLSILGTESNKSQESDSQDPQSSIHPNDVISPEQEIQNNVLNEEISANNEKFFTIDRIIESNIELNTHIISHNDSNFDTTNTSNYEMEINNTATEAEPQNDIINSEEAQDPLLEQIEEELTLTPPIAPLTDSLHESLCSNASSILFRQDSHTQTETPPISPLQLHDDRPLFGVQPPKKTPKHNNTSKIRFYRYIIFTLKALISSLFILLLIYSICVCSIYVSMSILVLFFTPTYYIRSCEGRKRTTNIRKRTAPTHSSTGTGPIAIHKVPSSRPGSPKHNKHLELAFSTNSTQQRIVPSLRGQASPR